MRTGVYQILNTKTGSSYVGSAVNVDARWRSHLHALKFCKKSPPKLQQAWNKYGAQAFQFRLLLECPPEYLIECEQLVIDMLLPKYNTRQEAASNYGLRWSDKINAAKGRKKWFLNWNGESVPGADLAKQHGLTQKALKLRLSRGWSLEAALAQPLMDHSARGKKGVRLKRPREPSYTAFGKTALLKDLAAEFSSVSCSTVSRRLALGWPIEKALTAPLVNNDERAAKTSEGLRRLERFQREAFGVRASLVELWEKFGVVPRYLVQARVQRGWTVEKALTTPKTK